MRKRVPKMKIKKVLPLCLVSCLVMTACSLNNGEGDVTESMTVSVTEVPPVTSEVSETEKQLLGDYTVTTAAEEAETTVTEPAETEPIEPVKSETFPISDLWPESDSEFINYLNYAIDESRICFLYTVYEGEPESEDHTSVMSFRLADIDTGEILGEWEIPDDDNTYIDNVYTDVEGALLKVVFYSYPLNQDGTTDYISGNLIYSVLTVYEDYTSDIKENASAADMLFTSAGNRQIAESGLDITDGDGNVIVAGSRQEGDEYGFYTRRQNYRFPVDENSFVYSTSGYESIPGFGLYDYETGTASDIPGSRDLIPMGAKDGKIYSYLSAWDGIGGSELFVTDTETLETTSVGFPFPEPGLNFYYKFFMPESGKYIAAVTGGSYEEDADDKKIYIIDPDTLEITAEYAFEGIPEYYNNSYNILCRDDIILWYLYDSKEIIKVYPDNL